MKAAICYEIVTLVARTLNIILKIPNKLWNVFTSSGTDIVGACQYSFKFNFSPRIRTTLVCMYCSFVSCFSDVNVEQSKVGCEQRNTGSHRSEDCQPKNSRKCWKKYKERGKRFVILMIIGCGLSLVISVLDYHARGRQFKFLPQQNEYTVGAEVRLRDCSSSIPLWWVLLLCYLHSNYWVSFLEKAIC